MKKEGKVKILSELCIGVWTGRGPEPTVLGPPASGCSPLAPGPPPWGCGLGNETVPGPLHGRTTLGLLLTINMAVQLLFHTRNSEQPWSFCQCKGDAAAETAPVNTDDAAAFQWEGSPSASGASCSCSRSRTKPVRSTRSLFPNPGCLCRDQGGLL